MEFANGEHMPVPSTQNHPSQKHMELIASCLRDCQDQESSQWQWWLGRLAFIRRLFDEHHSQLLLASENRINMASSLPVSPNSDIDLREFLNSLAENVHSEMQFSAKTAQRISLLAEFAAAALQCQHSKVVYSDLVSRFFLVSNHQADRVWVEIESPE